MSTFESVGGPAFPTEPNTQPGYYQHHGMSLRDWFAGQALAGVAQAYHAAGGGPFVAHKELIAEYAYACADAMLRARARPTEEPQR